MAAGEAEDAASRRYPARPVVGVGAVIFDDETVVLVRRRHAPLASRWSLPGGGLELGETLQQAVAREALEETGLVVDVGPVVDVVDHVATDASGGVEYHFVIADYLCWRRGGVLKAGGDAEAIVLAAISALEPFDLTEPSRSVIRRGFEMYTAFGGKNMNVARVGTVALAVSVLAVPVGAELKYTTKIEAHALAAAPATPPNPLLAMVGTLVLGMIAPPGGVEMTTVVGARGARVEFSQAFGAVPAGGVMLIKPDGSAVVIDPGARTFWNVSRSQARESTLKGAVDVRRSGTFETIAGARSERLSIDIRVAVPLPEGMQLPGVPADLAMSIDTWVTDKYKQYSSAFLGLPGLGSSLGLDRLPPIGFPMRSIIRSDLFGGQEVQSDVTSITEISAAASLFQVPDGYTEVAPRLAMPLPGVGR